LKHITDDIQIGKCERL